MMQNSTNIYPQENVTSELTKTTLIVVARYLNNKKTKKVNKKLNNQLTFVKPCPESI